MKRQHIALVTSLLAGLLPQAAQACGDGAYIGQVCFMATPFCPHGTLEANGQLLQISGNAALYSLLGIAYGGDARTNFGLPDLRGRSPRGQGQGVTPEGGKLINTDLGDKRGANSTTLLLMHMPAHKHMASFTPTNAFKVTASLPVSSSLGDVSILSSGTGYLAGLDGNAGKTDVDMKGPYTRTAPSAGSATLPVTAAVSYEGSGSVTVDLAGGSQPFSIDSPYLGLKACIVVDGIYPQKPY
ncbi:phage tail protein [Aeromonas veronii]|uniref:phage tail protein n=1 Tax=Aeromonas TaxID=642 RepID=UPI00111711E6|nr:tail fiber protein [Aeromonas veronii]TNI02265.1 phage tail protein [Aeromonas veronii]HDO1314097.1 tail fiber protein [Aeromonas veronii]